MRTVCLLKPDRAGDAIKFLPVLRALVMSQPNLDIHVVASEENASLFDFERGISLHVLPRHWKKMKMERVIPLLSLKDGQPYDVLLNVVTKKPEALSAVIQAIPANKRLSLGIDHTSITRLELANGPEGQEESANLAELVSKGLGVDLQKRWETLPSTPILSDVDRAEAVEKMGSKNGLWLGFCPFRGKGISNEPLSRWGKIIARATANKDFEKFFLIGHPKDYPYLEQLREWSPRKDAIEFAFPSHFRALAAFLERLDGVVVSDSGPLHLARAMELNLLGILGSSDFERWIGLARPGETFVKPGFLGRNPTLIEMYWALDRWLNEAPELRARGTSEQAALA